MINSFRNYYRAVILVLILSSFVIAAGAGEDTNNYRVIMTRGTVVPETTIHMTTVATPPPYLYVSFKSQPSGAALWIDNARHGTTPESAYFTESGTHTFRLSLAGYQEYAGQFDVPGPTEILITLTPVPPETTVKTTPSTVSTTPVIPVTTQPLDPGIMIAGLCTAGIILVMRRSV